MKRGIEELTFELLALEEDKRVREGAIGDVPAKLREDLSSSERRFYSESIEVLRMDIADLDKEICGSDSAKRLNWRLVDCAAPR